MKKLIALMACVLGLTLTACSDGAGSNPNLLLITDGGAAVNSAYGEQIAVTLNNINITPCVSGKSDENIRLMNKKGADIAIVPGSLLDYAYLGIEAFEGDGRLENISSIAALYNEAVYIIAPDDAGINSFDELKGKRVSVGEQGSISEAGARRLVEAYQLQYEDFDTVEYLSMDKSIEALNQRGIDAAIIIADVESPELSALEGVKLIPVSGEAASALIAKNPYYINYTVSSDAFAGKAGFAGVETVAVPVTLACRRDLDEETIYNITKALFEKKDSIAHDKAAALDAANASKGLAVSLHPGADRYYKEAAAAK